MVEAGVNLGLGFLISWASNVYLVPILFGVHMSAGQGAGIVLLFTAQSFVRQYFVRRGFNALLMRKYHALHSRTNT